MDPNRTVKIGDRVYYKDEGKHMQGTVVNIIMDEDPFIVKWDDGKENPDECVDGFSACQLGFAD